MAIWKIKNERRSAAADSGLVHPVVRELLENRGILTDADAHAFLYPEYDRDMHDPFLFDQMEKVVGRIGKAQRENEKVAVFGDYDADGVTSSVILRQTLETLGLTTLVYIPDKKIEGYGLNCGAIEQLSEQGVSLIITVDCGITGVEEVRRAQSLGVDVIITDHHHVPEILPEAFAIINPHIQGCGYPFADLAGVGVAFKLAQGIYKGLMPDKVSQTKWMLDLVAIGTVADCVPLIGENRIMVKYGLIVLAKTKRVGLQEMFFVGKIMVDGGAVLDSKKISFYIAPRINAAGRMDHANLAYGLISETQQSRARVLALELEESNVQRQKMTEQVVQEVKALAEKSFKDRKFIFAQGEHFPIGIIGLVAGRIAQQYNKPVAILQKGLQESKGSLRSIPYVNIIETIEHCSQLLVRYGGHSQAAGITVANDHAKAFYEKMDALIEHALEGVDITPFIDIDLELHPEEVSFSLLESLEMMRPFGEGNHEPVFLMKNQEVLSVKFIGSGNKHLKFVLKASDVKAAPFEAVAFNSAEKLGRISSGDFVDIAFCLQRNNWNGSSSIQLVLEDFRQV